VILLPFDLGCFNQASFKSTLVLDCFIFKLGHQGELQE
jgi:hypothetical protein